MSIQQPHPKDDINSKSAPVEAVDVETADAAGAPAETDEESASKPVNLQKRDYELDAVRFGDWELNGRCIDF